MFLRIIHPCALLVLLITGMAGRTAWAAAAAPRHVEDFIQRHCVECHGPEKQKGKLRLDTLGADFTDRETAAVWIEVRDKLNLGEMPPEEEPRPGIDALTEVSRWILEGVRQAERAAKSHEGGVPLRRLNRSEYANTLRDLLYLKFPPGESPLDFLPPDGTAEGFDKVGSALLLDPSLMTQYYETARRIAEMAIVDGPPEFPTETMRLEYEEMKDSGAIGYLTLRLGMIPQPEGLIMIEGATRSYGMLNYPGVKGNNVAPVNGFYRFTLKAGAIPGADGTIPRLRVTHNHPEASMEKIMEFDVDAPMDRPKEYSVVIPRDNLGGEINVEMVNGTSLYMSQRPGEHFIQRNEAMGEAQNFAEVIRLQGRQLAEAASGERSTPDPEKLDTSGFPKAFIDYLEVEGPLYDQWPPMSHAYVLGDVDPDKAGIDELRSIVARILPRAWRRPIEPSEVEPIVRAAAIELENGESFLTAVRVGLTAVLTSPNFIYLAETSGDAEQNRSLNGYELAARLSYFLWNSMPDDRLSELAANGRLTDSTVLEAEVDRMLADPKVEGFITSFARQWLQTDRFLAFAPDPRLYRTYSSELGASAAREPIEFFREVLKNDLSVLNFLDSDFLVVDERLAKFYGLENVRGEKFQRAAAPSESERGGLLGMLGVHLAGSDGIRTKPVTRGVYVRDVLFNDPPDPPPPNAGEIEPNIEGKNLTVRDRLIQHQKIEACAGCHRSIDPYGLALENFNVIGQWRDRQDGEDFRGRNRPVIDASGKLPNGRAFSNFSEYKSALLDQADRFRTGLAEKMFVYALGRPVEPFDQPAIDAATQTMRENDDTLRALIKAVVLSETFQTK